MVVVFSRHFWMYFACKIFSCPQNPYGCTMNLPFVLNVEHDLYLSVKTFVCDVFRTTCVFKKFFSHENVKKSLRRFFWWIKILRCSITHLVVKCLVENKVRIPFDYISCEQCRRPDRPEIRYRNFRQGFI